MVRLLTLVCSVFILSACSSLLSEATQDITFLTPGANDSVCYVDNGDVVYRVWPPDTINISRRHGDLKVRCVADGNREKTVTIETAYNAVSLTNAFNGFLPGMFIDSNTGALYKYPEVVTVDFTNLQSRAMALPNYHMNLMKNPDLFGMEEFRPGRAALISDKYDTVPTLQKRTFPDQAPNYSEFNTGVIEGTGAAETTQNTSAVSVGNVVAGDVPSDLVSGLTRQMNPSVFGASPEDSVVGGTSDTAGVSTGKGVASTGPVTIYSVEGP